MLIGLLSPGRKQQAWKDGLSLAQVKHGLVRSVDSAFFSIKMGSFSK